MIDLSYPFVMWGGTFICLFLFNFGVAAYSFKLRPVRRKYGITESKFRQNREYQVTPILTEIMRQLSLCSPKMLLETSLPELNPEKVPLFGDKLSCLRHNSTNFAEKVTLPQILGIAGPQ